MPHLNQERRAEMNTAFKINLRTFELNQKPVYLAFAVNDGHDLIARKGTKLDERLKDRCLKRNIDVISVYYHKPDFMFDDTATQQKIIVPKSVSSLGHKEIENFNKFAETFSSGNEKLASQFESIKQTGKVDEVEVYKLFQNMTEVIPIKSDLLKYTHFLKTHDDLTYAHSQKVALLCNMLGTWMKLSKTEIELVTIAGLVHDIGKTELDAQLLRKKEKLTNLELEQLKKHTKLGFDFIVSSMKDARIASFILDHHERVDGSGYSGKKASELNKYVNILMVCDVYAALTSDRPYKKAMDPFFAMKFLNLNERTKLDPAVMYQFQLNIAQQYIGSRVILTDNSEWQIVHINNADVTRPLLRNDAGEFFSLLDNKSVDILTLV